MLTINYKSTSARKKVSIFTAHWICMAGEGEEEDR